MTQRLRPIETNGSGEVDDDEGEDLLSELVHGVREIRSTLGRSPDHATGHEGSGLCKSVAYLMSEAAYRGRLSTEKKEREDLRRDRVRTWAAFIGGAIAFGGVFAGAVKFLFMVMK